MSNVVVDTEVYSCYGCEHLNIKSNEVSNTGGQSSKATPAGAVAKFATSGKKIRKTVAQSESRGSLLTMPSQSNVTESKDLGMIAKSYSYVYVAQVAMGASQAQYLCRKLRTPLKSKSNEVSNVIKEAFILRSLRSLSKVHWPFFTYHGPSLIICYAPCINHGIKIGMGRTQWQRLRTPLNKKNEVSNKPLLAALHATGNPERELSTAEIN